MDITAIVIPALILLPAAGLVVWAWFSMAQAEDDLLAFSAFEGLPQGS